MGTRSNIGIQENGSCLMIYCHWGGYPDHHAPILLGYSEDDVRRLVALGDLSTLGERVEPTPGSNHNYQHPEKGTTTAYHRDRGEELQPASECLLKDALREAYDVATGVWLFSDGGEWRPLTEVL